MREVVLTQLVAAKRSEDGRLRDAEAWPKVRLGDVCEINLGKTPPRGDRRYWDNKKVCGVRWLSIADLAETQDGFVNDCKEYITREAIEQCGVPIVKAGTFLLSFKLTLGRTAIAGCDLCTNEAIAALPLLSEYDGKIDLGYLGLYCCFFDWDEYASKDEKVLGKTLNKKKLAEVPILLPPLAVQREIVERLEKELGAVDKMTKGFEKIAADADALFKAELKEAFEEVKRSGAETKRLGDVCSKIGSGATPLGGKSTYLEEGISLIRSQNVLDLTFSYQGLAHISDKQAEKLDGVSVKSEDVLLNITGDSVARCCVVDDGCLEARVNQHVAIIRLKDKKQVSPKFLSLYLVAEKDFLLVEAQKGSTRKALTKSFIEDIEIPKLEFSEQSAIVAKLDAALGKSGQLKTAAEKGLEACAKLRKAILKEAFSYYVEATEDKE